MANFKIISITIIGIFILYILNKRKKRVTDYTLIFLNLICGGLLFSSLTPKSELTPFLFFLISTFPFWMFSVFMVYAAQLITDKAWKNYYLLFFLFSMPMTIYIFYDVFLAHENFNSILIDRYERPPLLYHFFFKGNMIYTIVLCLALLKKLKTYTLAIQNNFSYLEELRLKWLNHYAIAIIVLNAFSLVAFLALNIGWLKDIDNIYMVLNSLAMIAFFYLSFHGVKHYNMETVPLVEEPLILEPTPPKPSTPTKEDHNTQKVYQKLVQLFEETQLFTQPQLKLSDVADKMEIPPHQLSQIINSHFGKPFYDFVATYRIELLKKRLTSSDHKQYTILSLGLDCGFNSKASLNRVFKEHTGMTPSQFQKSHLPK